MFRALAVALLLAGCSTAVPQWANEDEVSFNYNAWFGSRADADEAATEHCGKSGRKATLVGQTGSLEIRSATYRCEPQQ